MRRAAALVLAATLGAGTAAAGDPPAPPPPSLAGPDAAARVATAQKLAASDPAGLARALAALGASKSKDPADRDFLVQYALGERARGLRLMALEAVSHVDRKGAAEWFRAKADGKDSLATVVALEALGLLGTKDDVPAALELVKNTDDRIAVAATNVVARLGGTKDDDALVQAALAHPSDDVPDHCCWALQDLLKKTKLVIALFEKFASKKNDPHAVRATSLLAMLQDKPAEPHVWGDTLPLARELMLAAPAAIEIKCGNKEFKANVQAGLDWLKKNMPPAEHFVRAAARRIDVPGKQPQDHVDFDQDAICIPLDRSGWKPPQMAFHLYWMATLVWEKRVGEPFRGHRGWETALYDVYDLCVVARLYDAGPGGQSRANFMKDQIEKKPWGSQ
jgi:hypothetical protein